MCRLIKPLEVILASLYAEKITKGEKLLRHNSVVTSLRLYYYNLQAISSQAQNKQSQDFSPIQFFFQSCAKNHLIDLLVI